MINGEVLSNNRGPFKITHQLLEVAEMSLATNVTEEDQLMYPFTAAPKQAVNVEVGRKKSQMTQ